ncbi:hypothetical protein DFJ74DRAFT_208166 [Hyaloraphidium curvatum]|nr:hypothetical protein DFJ74DRAFT_208166 [Hyaloraphidium curvatum]
MAPVPVTLPYGIPFVVLLLCIAVCPLVIPHTWEKWMWAFVLVCALAFLIPFAVQFGGLLMLYEVLHTVILEYIPFTTLIFALYVTAGGVVIEGAGNGTPMTNVLTLLIGAIFASIIGTTGTSMILIRPVLRSLARRTHRVHTIVFFIFIVSNVGGVLTPIGDPPVYLGFLKGIDFFWPLTNLIFHMLFAVATLLLIYLILDTVLYNMEMSRRSKTRRRRDSDAVSVTSTPRAPTRLKTFATAVSEVFGADQPMSVPVGPPRTGSVLTYNLPRKASVAFVDRGDVEMGKASSRSQTGPTAAGVEGDFKANGDGERVAPDAAAPQSLEPPTVAPEAEVAGEAAQLGTDSTAPEARGILVGAETNGPSAVATSEDAGNVLAASAQAATAPEPKGWARLRSAVRKDTVASVATAATAATQVQFHGEPERKPSMAYVEGWHKLRMMVRVGMALKPGLSAGDKFRISGFINIAGIGLVVALVVASGFLVKAYPDAGFTVMTNPAAPSDSIFWSYFALGRDLIFVGIGLASYFLFTPKKVHRDNNFTWAPFTEVAVLFIGIFFCLVPILLMFDEGVQGPLGFIITAVDTPAKYFWVTGGLSSFLDNSPTYLLFFNVAGGNPQELMTTKSIYLQAITAGAVFMGANTYIGNAPNFLVRNIAIQNKLHVPSFFGYMAWSLAIACPVWFLVTVIFFPWWKEFPVG